VTLKELNTIARNFAHKQKPSRNCTARFPVTQDAYPKIIDDSTLFRKWFDELFALYPEIFPDTFVDFFC
jgi:hypothetical protein